MDDELESSPRVGHSIPSLDRGGSRLLGLPLDCRKNDWRLNPIQLRVRTGNPVGVLRHHDQPLSTLLFNNHREQAEPRLTGRQVFIPIALDLQLQ